ncbi:MAG: alpha-L-arabinofuranosidase C-terminal domain-containing protein [Bacteroidota bacterium]|nr:alpha-L-arabinofuranosidase C-terminal domain-containing protein [Bacteroidota bacterium]
MKPWIDDAIDLVEFANGPVTSKWGAIRASMGHPKPFNLEYICLGNEEDDIPAFRERFAMAKDSLRKYYPGIKIIGTSGTTSAGRDYTSLWKFSRENQLAAVDEHYYNDPDWFLNNIHRYDNFDRKGPKVFIGEWASKDDQLYNAIVEAAYLTGIEKNADVVELTCYAPLLCNEKHQQWHPDLIRFDNTSVMKTPSYYVQQLYSINAGDNYIPSTVSYQPGFKLTSDDYSGMVGVGSWGTQVQYDELKLTSNNKLLYEDNFTAVSSDWTVQDGAFSCLNGVYAQTSEEQPALSINQKTEVSDTYTYTVKAMKTGGAEGFVIPFGYKDAKNYYWLNIGGWGNTQHAIERVSDGRKSTMYVVSGSIKNNQWYDIKVEVVRNVLKCYLDGQLIFNLPDPTGPVTASVTEDVKANDYLIKLVNSGSESISSSILISGMPISQNAGVTTLTGNKADKNSLENPDLIKPVATTIKVSNSFEYTLPPYSFQIFRFSKGHPVAMKPASKPLKKK